MEGIKIIKDDNQILAIIIDASFSEPGLSFITPNNFPLQVGVHQHSKNYKVKPHAHIPIFELKDINAQEIFHIQKGKVKVNIYDGLDRFHSAHVLNEGDTIFLATGGHGVEFLEDSQLIEFKQGPYRGAEKEKRYING